MRIHRILSFSFMYVFLLILALNSTVIADDLVDINIPSMESVRSQPKYTNPSKDFTNQMTQWSNTVTNTAKHLETRGDILVHKRDVAKIAAFGPDDQWQGNVINWIANTVTQNWIEPVKDFAKGLLGKSDKIDREQSFAESCQAVNDISTLINDAQVMMDSMFEVAETVRNNYISNGGSKDDLSALTAKPSITIPDKVTPRWYCKGNGFGSGVIESLMTCYETYKTPYEARDDHKIVCGGYQDPNPNVAGCGYIYYSCVEGADKNHVVVYCTLNIAIYKGFFGIIPTIVGKCGAGYRECFGSMSKKGIHSYKLTKVQGTNSVGNSGEYATGIEANPTTEHRGAAKTPLAVSINGPNGVGLDESDYDDTLKCDTCIDGSDYCPNASTKHSKTTASVPDTPSTTTTTPSTTKSPGVYISVEKTTVGDSVDVEFVPKATWSTIYWYRRSPSDSSDLGEYVDSSYGTGDTSAASTSITIPSDGLDGNYKITAYVYYSDNSIEQYSSSVFADY